MRFGKDVLDGMKDCILSLFWAKKDIVSFFESNGCTKKDLKDIQINNKLSRYELVETVFNRLQNRSDNGIGQFSSILDSLCSWNYFNPYYFEQLKKLDRNKAEKAIGQVRRLKAKHAYRIEEFKKKKMKILKKVL